MAANRLIVAVFVLVALIGCGGEKTAPAPAQVQASPSATTLPAPALAASEKPVILLYADGYGGLAADPPVQPLEVAVWADGRIVWRDNNALLQGRVDTKKIDELLQRLHREGVFGSGVVEHSNFGPDSGFNVIEIRLTDRTLKLQSWHERFEQDPKLVATPNGIESLEGRDRDAVLAAQPPEYLRFRRIWSDIHSAVKAWTPAKGEPFRGTVPTGRGG